MLPNNLPIVKKETKTFDPLPEDIYQVELLDITAEDKETYNSKMGKTQEKEYETILSFQFTLLDGTDNGESLRGRNVWANFVPSFLYISAKNGKNALYRIVEALQGKTLSPEQEANGIDGAFLNSLIGKQCRIVTKNKAGKEGNLFTNIESFLVAKTLINALTAYEKENATVKKEKEQTQPTGAQDSTRNEYVAEPDRNVDVESNLPQYDEHGNPNDIDISDVDFGKM